MSNEDLIGKGIETIKQAINAENANNLPEALKLYKQGLDHLSNGLKGVKDKKTKQVVTEKIKAYLAKAEEVQAKLAKSSSSTAKPAANAAAPSSTSSSSAAAAQKKPKSSVGGKNDAKDGKPDEAKEEEKKEDPEITKLKASLSQAIVLETPNVKWEDVAGLETAKSLLKEAVLLPIKFPQLFVGKRTPWKGILLYGPPGTGKSFLAKAVATEAGASTFFSVSSSDLVSKFQGESERLVRNLFDLARAKAPSIIFIDEIDSMCGNRSDGENDSARRIKTEFLVQMQGVGKTNDGILVLGATNTPWDLDPAIRRRFEKRIYIPLPESIAREVMYHIHIGDTPNSLISEDYKWLGDNSNGLSGSDISVVVRDALMEPVRFMPEATHFRKIIPDKPEDYMWEACSPGDGSAVRMEMMQIEGSRLSPPPVTFRDFVKVLATAKPSVSEHDIQRHEDWTKEFGQEG